MRCCFGRFDLDLARRELRAGGLLRPLQPLAFDLLGYLVRHRQRVVPKQELLRELWRDAIVTDASLQRAVSLARRALWPEGDRLLRTHARHGYRFAGEVTELERDALEASLDTPPGYVRQGAVHIAYRTVGSGPVDVVLVLGWCISMRSALELEGAAELVRALAPSARVILFDKRGSGTSDRVTTPFALRERVQDLGAVLDAVRSPGAVLVGISSGGPTAIALAASRPERVRALALVGSYAKMGAGPDHPFGWSEERIRSLRGYLSRGWGAGTIMRTLVPERHLTPQVSAWAARTEQEGASPGAGLDLLEMSLSIDVRPLLRQLRAPTVVLHAGGDRVVRVENGRALAATIPGARLVEVPCDDHLFLFQERARLTRELRSLVERVSAPGRIAPPQTA